MTRGLETTPTYWLTPKDCESVFGQFKERIDFDEPIPPFDSRFPGRLESILESVRQTFDRQHLNPTVLDAAAAYFNQLVRGHAFQNGNKRLAILFTHVFLLRNGIDFKISWQGMYNLSVWLASAAKLGLSAKETGLVCKDVIEDYTRRSTDL